MLVVEVHAKNETRSFPFDQPVITLGRADVNDIVLPTAKVSKRHARLEATAQGLILTDIKSTNGTYLNGRKVLAPAVIGESDRVLELENEIALRRPRRPDEQQRLLRDGGYDHQID